MRSVKVGLAFGVIGLLAAIGVSFLVFGAHRERAYSTLDAVLLEIAMWPQMLAMHLGVPFHSSFASLSVNFLGWAVLGLLIGSLWRGRGARPRQTI